MRYRLLIIWDDGTRTRFNFETVEEAKAVEYSLNKILGDRIEWSRVVSYYSF